MAVAEEEDRPNDDSENGDRNSNGNGSLLTLIGALLLGRDGRWRLGADSFPEGDGAGTAKVIVGRLHLDAERLGCEECL